MRLVALLLLAACAGESTVAAPDTDTAPHATAPGASRSLLVAIDTLTGQARGLELVDTFICETAVRMGTDPVISAYPEMFGLRKAERFDCRVPK
ncbi:MAG: hypothetical protein A2V88_15415 [Elusimicrobia bacterium RBG_16_66_12]|nr:MAG: hypothetical protein A2V88_15415 [Elusimicrobia bacterium RBG_16_66_12]